MTVEVSMCWLCRLLRQVAGTGVAHCCCHPRCQFFIIACFLHYLHSAFSLNNAAAYFAPSSCSTLPACLLMLLYCLRPDPH